MKVIGLMSGTSMDGIDAALLDINRRKTGLRFKLLAFETFPFPKDLPEKLIDVAEGNETTALISHLNFYMGELFAEASFKIAAKAKVEIHKVDLIGSHGQTIWHAPAPIPEGRYKIRSTFQIGEPSVIAVRTGVTTIADFRPADVAAGGEGAPLAPYFHHALDKKKGKSRLMINIGGISNVTFLPRSSKKKILAFDTGPGNILIDGLVQAVTKGKSKMDRNGRIAAKGNIHLVLLNELMDHPFMDKKPPKSTGRETFGLPMIDHILDRGNQFKLSFEDLMATVTAFTSMSIFMNCETFILKKEAVDEVIVGGGGARNPMLMAFLKKAFHPVPFFQFEDLGLNGKAIEAMAFALFAYDTFHAIPDNVPSVTGAKKPVIMGKISPGNNFKKLFSSRHRVD
ncbi:MAG: anhydro-N-acetylmuramic acid kinase [Nitrospirae bacterium]|nr:anhydro-N-acetylmuramic acid kinase [Nitrospirota bacterium]